MPAINLSRLTLAGSYVLLFFFTLALLAPWLAPHDPYQINLQNKLKQPDLMYPLGTDSLGRCVLSRLIYGTRATLLGALCIVIAISGTGLLLGLTAGYGGLYADRILAVVIDIFLSIPDLVWMLALVGLWGIESSNLVLALILSHWAVYARISRNMAREIGRTDYLLAAKTLRTPWPKILTRHVLPNIFPRLLVLITLDTGKFILAIAGFSFLGLGVQPPTPEWGAMLSEGKGVMQDHWQLMLGPGFCIMLLVASFTLVGEGLRDDLDPRYRQ